MERYTLIEVLRDHKTRVDPDWEAVWIAECEDRLKALDRGEMQTYEFDEVMAEARARIKW